MGMKRQDKAMRLVLDVFDDVTDPGNMTKREYEEFTADLISDLEIRLEAVREELSDEE